MSLREHGIIHITRARPDQQSKLDRLQAVWDRKSIAGEDEEDEGPIGFRPAEPGSRRAKPNREGVTHGSDLGGLQGPLEQFYKQGIAPVVKAIRKRLAWHFRR